MNRELPEGATERIYHLKPEGSFPGATLVIITLANGREFTGSAKMSQLDQFSRSRGRVIARGRALKKAEQAKQRRSVEGWPALPPRVVLERDEVQERASRA